MVKSTALHPAPQPAPQPSVHVPTSNWHPQPPPHPPFPPQIQYLARSSPAVKLGETVTQPVDAKPPAIEPPARPQVDYFTNFLSTLLKAGVVSVKATPTGAGAAYKELAMSVDIPKSADSSDAVIRDYRDDNLILRLERKIKTTISTCISDRFKKQTKILVEVTAVVGLLD